MKSSEWQDDLKEIILNYTEHRISDPFMAWFRQKDACMQNTKRGFEAGVLEKQLGLNEIPQLIPRHRMTAENWTTLFHTAIPRLHRLATHIDSKKSWTAQELLNLMRSPHYKVPYLGVKTSRLAVRWLHELVPNLKIDMSNFKVPVDRLVYRVACRLGIISPKTDTYYGDGSPADKKIQALAKSLFPKEPWLLDEPLWSTGRQPANGGHCYPTLPKHEGCIFESICPKKFTEYDPSEIGMQQKAILTRRPNPRKQRTHMTHAELIREAVEKLKEATPKQIMHFIRQHHPETDVKETSFRADIIGCSVNHTSSHHYPGMPKFLFYNKPRGTYRLHNPDAHAHLARLAAVPAHSQITVISQWSNCKWGADDSGPIH